MLFIFYKLKTSRNFGSFKCYNRNSMVNWQGVAAISIWLNLFKESKDKADQPFSKDVKRIEVT